MGGLICAGFHQVARLLDLRPRWQRQPTKSYGKFTHIILLAATPAFATDLPRPLTADDFITPDPAQAKLGQLLFYDRILSGNRNIACSTCHHPDLGTADGLSLGIGEGGVGLGPQRTAGTGDNRIRKRIPRNAPGLWNLGAKDLHVMFHDGRLSIADTFENGFNSPAEEWLPEGLENLLAAQAIFPLVAQFEMAGNPKENEVAGAVQNRMDYAWPILTDRVRHIPEYTKAFAAAYDHINGPQDITIADIANALSAFMIFEWTSLDSPFDAYLNGDLTALTQAQRAGMDLFFGAAGCAGCHSGPLMSDQGFHALGLPPFGPGRTRRFDPMVRDVGRMGESDALEDAYAFRTPMLRNVALTAPYGHNGAYPTLDGIVRHHLNPEQALAQWQPEVAALPEVPWLAAIDFMVWQDPREMARQRAAVQVQPTVLSDAEVDAIVQFLHALTGQSARDGLFGIPDAVPSGLPVDHAQRP
ncbi:cytochrome c peroxidase [uncultured Tateyamaria sp.]|uniref:cytochrome-c peroxidase n=1 Tax=Tateyamaria sp. 1078 TaxID=3417464 RepID=UPI0034377A91